MGRIEDRIARLQEEVRDGSPTASSLLNWIGILVDAYASLGSGKNRLGDFHTDRISMMALITRVERLYGRCHEIGNRELRRELDMDEHNFYAFCRLFISDLQLGRFDSVKP